MTQLEHPTAWRLTVPCTRLEAQAIMEADEESLFPGLAQAPVLSASEPDPARPALWHLEAYFGYEPEEADIAAVKALVPGATFADVKLLPLPATDWVSQSQAGMAPIIAGRFRVRNSAQDGVESGRIDLLVSASRAFGTGQHETTRGCLMMLDRLRRRGMRFGNVADIGTGTGLLAFAALRLWPRAHAIASDIDPVAIAVAAGNAAVNGIALGSGSGALVLRAAPGVDDDRLVARAPYDLVIANILAGPLVELAPGLSTQLAEGGMLVLAGLLDVQADRVIAAYRARGVMLIARIDQGDWPTLLLRKRHRAGWRRPERWRRADHGEAPGFGSF
jgi:ribosomal protein L11 methyltransferase